jgi:hypothetical protein
MERRQDARTEPRVGGSEAYEAPELRVMGALAELTQGCVKQSGGADGFIFQGTHLVCTSP